MVILDENVGETAEIVHDLHNLVHGMKEGNRSFYKNISVQFKVGKERL